MNGEIFRGHTEECFSHLIKWFNSKIHRGQHGRFAAMKPMMDFCEISRQTVERWMDESLECISPKGEILLKLLCYLDLLGYKVIEFERMPKVLRNFAELIGYGILSAQQASELVGYLSGSQQTYAVLWEKEGLGKDKETKMWEIWKERRDELDNKKQLALKSSRLEILFKPTPKEKPLVQQVLALPEPTKSFSSRYSAMLLIMEGVLMSFEEGMFDNLSPDDLATLNVRSCSTVLRLSTHLNALSSKLMAIGKGVANG